MAGVHSIERNCPIRLRPRVIAFPGPDRLSRSGGAILGRVGRALMVLSQPESSLGSHGNDDYSGWGPSQPLRSALHGSSRDHLGIVAPCVRARGLSACACACAVACAGAGGWDVRPYSFVLSELGGERVWKRRQDEVHDRGRSQPTNPLALAGPANRNPRGQSGPRFRSARFVASGSRLAGEWGGLTGAECRRLKR